MKHFFTDTVSDPTKRNQRYIMRLCLCAFISLLSTLSSFGNKIDDIRRSAINGDADAQYEYALWKGYAWNEKQDKNEHLDWLAQASKNGNQQATALLALENILDSNHSAASENIKQVSRDLEAIVNNGYDIHISVGGIKTLVNYILANPAISLTGFGPTHKGGSFIFEKGDTIYACVAGKSRTGLLKLNKDGNRIRVDDIPLGYDYIIPFYGEMMSLGDAVKDAEWHINFIVGPYKYSLPFSETEMRMLDINGNEVYRSIYGSDCERVEIPGGFVFDSENGPVLPSRTME